jgi:hypothetical protein
MWTPALVPALLSLLQAEGGKAGIMLQQVLIGEATLPLF